MAKLLLVEDNEMNRDMLSRRPRRRGYEVIMAFDGLAATTLTQSDAPALILLDLNCGPVDLDCQAVVLQLPDESREHAVAKRQRHEGRRPASALRLRHNLGADLLQQAHVGHLTDAHLPIPRKEETRTFSQILAPRECHLVEAVEIDHDVEVPTKGQHVAEGHQLLRLFVASERKPDSDEGLVGVAWVPAELVEE